LKLHRHHDHGKMVNKCLLKAVATLELFLGNRGLGSFRLKLCRNMFFLNKNIEQAIYEYQNVLEVPDGDFKIIRNKLLPHSILLKECLK